MAALPTPCSATVAAIYAAYEAKQDNGYRAHLGASLIGTECERALFYSFRWATRARFDGRMLRLFETGNLAESRFVADLRAIGCTVHDTDENGDQFSFRDETGHFGGSMDGVALGIPEAPETFHVCEFKTHGAKSFAKLKADGVEKAKPLHHAQMQTYMHMSGLDRAIYLAVNKDSDELYSEIVHYDPAFALKMLAKAARVIAANEPPPRISNDPSWYVCRFCDHAPTCHAGKLPERHCRSCLHSTPVDGGEWHCAHNGRAMDRAEQEEGCEAHLYLPGFVPGEQVDVRDEGAEIVYQMRDGSTWIDGVI